jgi:hypothetical protein
MRQREEVQTVLRQDVIKAVLLALFSAILLGGCATNRVDWNARVGQYTYDDAITELGVPDRSATLTDGTTVAEWLTSRGASYGTSHGFGWRFQTYDVTQFPDRYLRLVFGPDKRLIRSENFAR